jgi:2-dehydropantoate 2-reductase
LQSKQYRVTVELRLSEHQQPVLTSSKVSAEVTTAPVVIAKATSSSSDGSSSSRAEALAEPGRYGPEQHDLIHQLIVTTKANHAVQALSAIKHRLSQDSVVVLLQNGVLGVYQEALQSVFPDPDLRPAFLLGSTTHGAYSIAHFHVVHASPGSGSCVFGLPRDTLQAQEEQGSRTCDTSTAVNLSVRSGTSGVQLPEQQEQELPVDQKHHKHPQLQQQGRIQNMLSVLGSLHKLQPAVLSPDQLHQQLLLKLLINCCANPLSALLHCRNGGLVGNKYAEDMWLHVTREFAEVFAADLNDTFGFDCIGTVTPGTSSSSQHLERLEQRLFAQVRHVVDVNSTNFNSMLQSVVKHQQTEIDYINGFVLREGQARAVPTPWNHMLWTLIKAREAVPVPLLTNELL